MGLYISSEVRHKLSERHNVDEDEIAECFDNKTHSDLIDTRLDHQTDPPTRWFISRTDKGRILKIVYIYDGQYIRIKTAYHPTDNSISVYYRYSYPESNI